MQSVVSKPTARQRATRLIAKVAMGLLVSGALIGQQNYAPTGIVWPQSDAGTSGVITVHQLRHSVPGKARKELQKAETARLAGRNEEAINRYRAVVTIDPKYVEARNNLGILYATADRIRLGIDQLEEAIKTDP